MFTGTGIKEGCGSLTPLSIGGGGVRESSTPVVQKDIPLLVVSQGGYSWGGIDQGKGLYYSSALVSYSLSGRHNHLSPIFACVQMCPEDVCRQQAMRGELSDACSIGVVVVCARTSAHRHGCNSQLRQRQPPRVCVSLRGWWNTVEIVLFEISNSMKPYPSYKYIEATLFVFEPTNFDGVSNRIPPTSHSASSKDPGLNCSSRP